MNENSAINWTCEQVIKWSENKKLSKTITKCIKSEDIDGRCLLTLTENDIRDLRDKYGHNLKISDIKSFYLAVKTLQKDNFSTLICLGFTDCLPISSLTSTTTTGSQTFPLTGHHHPHIGSYQHHHGGNTSELLNLHDIERISPPLSVDGRATSVPPEVFKTFISLGYSFLVTWITAIVMVVVHERVPDMKRYPPLPDIFLDNVPHIPWAFHMCEITGTLLFAIWSCVCIFHKYRLVLLRRFFALAGTVFLLRCVTMLITSLSVPGTHLQCNQNDHKVDDTNLTLSEAIQLRISRAYIIWSGLGMSIQGVRTCGDYMFSGHTVALTLLNFFITEYTPRNLYFLHTMTWLLNMFGIFFILAAHEHYSIDVFVAFYITSRLFLYYHTLANNQALMSHDSNRTRIWFPMFSYFESSVDGIIPNEYDSITDILSNIFSWVICIKDSFMLTARRIWIVPPHLPHLQKTFIRPSSSNKTINSTNNTNNSNSSSNNISDNVLKLSTSNEQQNLFVAESLTKKLNDLFNNDILNDINNDETNLLQKENESKLNSVSPKIKKEN